MKDQFDIARLKAASALVKEILSEAGGRIHKVSPRYSVTRNSAIQSPRPGGFVPFIVPSADYAREELGWSSEAVWRKAGVYLEAIDKEPGIVLQDERGEPLANFQPALRLLDERGPWFVVAGDAKGLADGSVTDDGAVLARAVGAVLERIEAYWRSLQPKSA